MSKVYTLSEMVDLALATPKIGVVNCFMLHALLHALIKRLNIGGCSATILAKGDKDYPWTELPPKTTEDGKETEPSVVVVKVTPVPQTDDNAGSQFSLQEKSPAKYTGAALDKKPSKQEQSRPQTLLPSQDGDNAAESRGLQKEPSSASKINDSDSLKKKPSALERSKSKRTASPTASSTRISDDPQTSRGLQKEPSASKKEATGHDSENIKKKPTSLDRSKSKRGMGQIPSSSRDGDGAKDTQGLKKEQRSQDSAGVKKKPSSGHKSKPQSQSDEDSNGPEASPDDDGLKETSLKSYLESDKESPQGESTQTTEDQFGLPFLESGVSNLKDVRALVKNLSGRMADNENDIKRLADKTTNGSKSKLDRLSKKVLNMMDAMGRLENAVFGDTKDGNELGELSRKVDQMVKMSTNLEDNVLDKIVPEGSSDEGIKAATKRKSKKEMKKYQRKQKESSQGRSSKSEPDSSEGSDKEKPIPVVIKSKSDEEPCAASPSPLSSSPSMEEAPSPPPPVIPATPAEPAEPAPKAEQEVKPIKVKEQPEVLVKKPSKKQEKQDDSIDHLQKKVNMVLHLMCNLEKVVKDASSSKEKTEGKISSDQQSSPESSDKKTEDEKEKVIELKPDDSKDDQSDHSKQKQNQGSFQMLFSRIKKLEDDMQKLQQFVSSDSSSSSNLTKMVGDFLSTISTSPSSAQDSEPGTKKSRKEKRGKRKKKQDDDSKDLAEKEEGEEVVEGKKEEVGGEEPQNEEEEEAVASDVEEAPQEIQPEEIPDIVIIQDSVPEKLSEVWDNLKILANALRGVKGNVVSLEKNSKNMAKAMQLLMRGNTNIIDEDFEIIGELKVVVRKLYSDYNNLNAMVLKDRDILLSLTVTVDNLISGLNDTKSHFAGKMENFRNTLIQKADKHDVDNMVSSVGKKLNISDYRREMDNLKSDIQDQEDKFKMDVQQLKNDKYDRFEMDIFRIWVECKLSATKKRPQANAGAELYQDDGAILKKQIPFHCLSCDKNLLITPQPLIPIVSLPPTKRNSSIPTNEGDSSRLLKKRSQVTQSILKPVDKVLLEGKDNKLYKGNKTPAHNDVQKVMTPDEVTSRPGKEDPLPPLNGAVPSKSEHDLSRRVTRKKSLQRKSKISDAKSES